MQRSLLSGERTGTVRPHPRTTTWTWPDLLLFLGAVYGIVWGITKSSLLRPVRELCEEVPFLGKLVQCVVCTGTWVALALALALPCTTLFSDGFRVRTPVDVIVLVSWAVAAVWALARLLGDAYLAEEDPKLPP